MNILGLEKLTELCEEDEIGVRGGTSLIYDGLSSIAVSDPSALVLFPGLRKADGVQFQVTTTRTPDGSGVSISAVAQSR